MELERLSQAVAEEQLLCHRRSWWRPIRGDERGYSPVETPLPPCVSEEVEVEVEVTPPGLLSDLPPRCCLHAAEFWWVVQKSSDTAVKQARKRHTYLPPSFPPSVTPNTHTPPPSSSASANQPRGISPSSRGKDMSREPMACWLRASFYWLRGSVSSRRLQPGEETRDAASGLRLHWGWGVGVRAWLSNCAFTNLLWSVSFHFQI